MRGRRERGRTVKLCDRRFGRSRRTDPKQILAAGYEQVAERFSAWGVPVPCGQRGAQRRVLLQSLPDGGRYCSLAVAQVCPLHASWRSTFI